MNINPPSPDQISSVNTFGSMHAFVWKGQPYQIESALFKAINTHKEGDAWIPKAKYDKEKQEEASLKSQVESLEATIKIHQTNLAKAYLDRSNRYSPLQIQISALKTKILNSEAQAKNLEDRNKILLNEIRMREAHIEKTLLQNAKFESEVLKTKAEIENKQCENQSLKLTQSKIEQDIQELQISIQSQEKLQTAELLNFKTENLKIINELDEVAKLLQ